jgi:hypothetical protein
MPRLVVGAGCVVALVATAACGGKKGSTGVEGLAECAKNLAALAGSTRPDASMLATACPHVCPEGLAAYAGADSSSKLLALVGRCGFLCGENDEAISGAHPARRVAMMIEGCGREYYGLAAGQESMLSPDWFVAQRIGKWLADARRGASSDQAAALDRATADLRIPLPLPAAVAGGYELPAGIRVDPPRGATAFVIVGDDLRVVTAPAAVLTADGAKIVGGPPGKAVELANLAAELGAVGAESGGAMGGTTPPIVNEEPAEESMEDEEEEGGTGRRDDMALGKMGVRKEPEPGGYRIRDGAVGRPPGVLSALAGTKPLSLAAPVILADKAGPAVRVLEVVAALAGRELLLAVSLRGQLAVLQANLRAGEGIALAVVIRDGGLVVASPVGRGELAKIGADHDWPELERALRDLREPTGAGAVTLAAEGSATTQDLAAAVDAAIAAGFLEVNAAAAPEVLAWADQQPRGHGGGLRGFEGDGINARLGQAIVTGDIDRVIVRRWVRQKLPMLAECYRDGLAHDPTLAGEVVARFTIAPTGRVVEVTADGVSSPVAACVKEVIEGVRFPRREAGEVLVVFPIQFEAGK